MFFFSSAPMVDLLDVQQNQVVLTCRKTLKVGRDTPVRITLRSPEGSSQVVSSRVFVHQARPMEGGKIAYIATLQKELPFQPLTQAADHNSLRRGQRIDCSLRVMSADIPGFAGIAVDISESGLQLQTRQGLTLGHLLALRIDSTMDSLPMINIQARVAWSRREDQRGFRSGLEFCDSSAEARAQVQELARYLQRREQSNLTQMVLECADRYLSQE